MKSFMHFTFIYGKLNFFMHI